MFSFVVTLVVVGTCLFVATRIAIGQEPQVDKPATPVPQRVRGRDREADHGDLREDRPEVESSGERAAARPSAGDGTEQGHRVSPWRRVRAMVLLAVLLTALGLVLALVIAIFGAVVLNALRSAVQ